MIVKSLGSQEIDQYVANRVLEKINMLLSTQGRAVVALSGGSSPKVLYNIIGEHLSDSNVHFLLVDERVVPYCDERNNARFVSESLGPSGKRLLSYVTEGSDKLKESRKLLHKYPEIDFAVMGMGSDGHTASLFTLDDTKREGRLVEIVREGDDVKRFSLSFSELMKIGELLFFIKGEEKKEMVEMVLDNKKSELIPAGLVVQKHSNISLYYQE